MISALALLEKFSMSHALWNGRDLQIKKKKDTALMLKFIANLICLG